MVAVWSLGGLAIVDEDTDLSCRHHRRLCCGAHGRSQRFQTGFT